MGVGLLKQVLPYLTQQRHILPEAPEKEDTVSHVIVNLGVRKYRTLELWPLIKTVKSTHASKPKVNQLTQI